MRRKLSGVFALAVAVVAAGACAKPAGVDGNLTNGWPRLPEAKIAVPVAGSCYSISGGDPSDVTKWPPPVECTASHNVETMHVGTFTGADGDRATPPSVGSPGRRKAYEECAEKAKDFLGDDWRVGRVELFLVTPIATHWEAGARWFRCDVVEYKDLEDYDVVARTSSAKGALAAGSGSARLGCLTITTGADKRIDKMLPVDCNATHNGEFAGVFVAPDTAYPADTPTREAQNLNGCRPIVAAYAGIPDDANFRYRTGQIASGFTKADWELGNRGVRCYIWPGKNVTTSLKGVGTAGLPINYAG